MEIAEHILGDRESLGIYMWEVYEDLPSVSDKLLKRISVLDFWAQLFKVSLA